MSIDYSTFRVIIQKCKNDCGIACIKMLCHYYSIILDEAVLNSVELHYGGISIENMVKALKAMGFQCTAVQLYNNEQINAVPLPVIACVKWGVRNLYHYIVIYEIKDNIISYADPANGMRKKELEEFLINFTSEIIIINSCF